ncbi:MULTISPECIES: hypothetical protein [Chromobacterium]|uniref:hypothetical protein n=1 Tax=Chromobacterium TaxID=535 RepID=UPI0005BBD1A6|nr:MULTISPECIES: hypothetical protein [Chromobacterium]KMN36517.1 hypothetical protein VI26_06675 [Chromobacterium sp. LK1]
MIGHNTELRDFIQIAQGARASELVPKVRSKPETPEHRRRRGDYWQRQLERELAGEDPINDKAA